MMGKIQFICRKPGKKSIRIIERDHKIISPSLTREYSFVFKRARGCYVYDVDGRRYLDFAAGVAVAGIGHTNPVIEKALHKQIKLGIHAAFSDFYAELPLEFSEFLLTFMHKQLDTVFLSNSGTESIEAAYKLARWHSQRKWVIAFENAFHGRTMGSLSLTKSKPVQRGRYSPFLPVKHAPFPYHYRMKMEPEDCSSYCLTELERAIRLKRGDVAAIFLEPVQGEGGYIVPPRSFVKGVRKLCNEYGVLLCDDEVQSGCFRTGRFLAIENFGVVPDVVSLSKAIGGGVPLGATVAGRKVMDWAPGSHANTFGGNLLACAAGIATLKFMREKKLGQNAQKIGKHMLKRLNELKDKYEIVGDVRGLGLMIGVELVKNKKSRMPAVEERKEVLCKASEKGLILLPAGMSVIRICPPLTLTRQQADNGIDIIEDSIKELNRR